MMVVPTTTSEYGFWRLTLLDGIQGIDTRGEALGLVCVVLLLPAAIGSNPILGKKCRR